jgi:hypothetical protein
LGCAPMLPMAIALCSRCTIWGANGGRFKARRRKPAAACRRRANPDRGRVDRSMVRNAKRAPHWPSGAVGGVYDRGGCLVSLRGSDAPVGPPWPGHPAKRCLTIRPCKSYAAN